MPVFKRETANKMYTPTTYFLGRVFSHLLLQLIYPITFVLIVFWGLSIDQSFTNFVVFIFYAMLLNLIMSAQGYFCGILSDEEETA